MNDTVSGPDDWTQAIDGSYAGGGPQLPGIAGNEPVPGGQYQPGSGRVLRGGRAGPLMQDLSHLAANSLTVSSLEGGNLRPRQHARR